jgi:Bacterial SH3 domain
LEKYGLPNFEGKNYPFHVVLLPHIKTTSTMFKTLITLLAFFSCSLAAIAQEEDYDAWMHADGSLAGFEAGRSYFTLVTDANLREQPNTQSAVLTKLPIATSVEIQSVSTDSLTLRGVKLPWVKVSYGIQSGYIWGGFLALASIQTPNDEYMPNAGVQYLTGVAAYDEQKHQLTVQVRVAKDNKELSKCEFTTQGDLSYYPEFSVSFEPLSKVKSVLEVNYYYPACGYPSGDNLLFWQENNQLIKVLETSSVSEAGLFYSTEEFILPSQRGGIGDHVIVTNDQSEFEERGEELVRTNQKVSIALYKWANGKLTKTKELK